MATVNLTISGESREVITVIRALASGRPAAGEPDAGDEPVVDAVAEQPSPGRSTPGTYLDRSRRARHQEQRFTGRPAPFGRPDTRSRSPIAHRRYLQRIAVGPLRAHRRPSLHIRCAPSKSRHRRGGPAHHQGPAGDPGQRLCSGYAVGQRAGQSHVPVGVNCPSTRNPSAFTFPAPAIPGRDTPAARWVWPSMVAFLTVAASAPGVPDGLPQLRWTCASGRFPLT